MLTQKTILDLSEKLSKIPTKPSIRVHKDDKQKLIDGLEAESASKIIGFGIDIIESSTCPRGFAVFYQARNSAGEPEIFTIKLEDNQNGTL